MRTSNPYMVSVHACERYFQRVLGGRMPIGSKLSPVQLSWVNQLIMDDIEEIMPTMVELGDGKYKHNDVIYVMKDSKMVTVKTEDGTSNKLSKAARNKAYHKGKPFQE